MATQTVTPPPATDTAPAATDRASIPDPAPVSTAKPESRPSVRESDAGDGRRRDIAAEAEAGRPTRRPAVDYAATRLVNFRLPVDLHDRYKQLVQDAERAHRRLRHPSLTELVIALMEEGPDTVDGVAALIRRKRADEHDNRPRHEPLNKRMEARRWRS